MDKIWLKNYPQGISAEIDISRYASIPELFTESIHRFSDKPAFANMGRELTFSDLDRISSHFAAYLQHGLGLKKGDRIAIMLPNILQYPVALFGALRVGLIVVNTNPLYTARELKHQLVDSGATAIVILENFAHVLEEALSDTAIEYVIVTGVGDLLAFPKSNLINLAVKYIKKGVPSYHLPRAIRFQQCLKEGVRYTMNPVEISSEDIAFLQYTGGTTGISKGAMLTHGNMTANVLQAIAWLGPVLKGDREIIITALPLYHIFSLTANCLFLMSIGGLNYLITNPRDFPGFVKALATVEFTCFTGVNTLFNRLLHTPGFAELDFSKLKLTLGGGMAVQRTVANQWKQVTGCQLTEAYGLTETSPAACINPTDLEDFSGMIGLPISSTECSIQDEQGNHLAIGETGELCFKGPQVMLGYWNKPEETAQVLSDEGWLRTGDIAVMDEQGYVRIVDRKKDMIVVSGFNVYPNEVESVVAAHPGVLEVGAIGIPDKESGEVVKIVVVKKDPGLTKEALYEYCKEQLTAYKVPKHIEFRPDLPKSNVGKILRRELRSTA